MKSSRHSVAWSLVRRLACIAATLWWLAPAGADVPPSFYLTPFERHPDVAALTRLGRVLFLDRTLSASGRMACASCHDPRHAYGPPNARSVQLGGARLDQPGLRAVPSLMYRQYVPHFAEHYFEPEGDGSDQGPRGGLTWDGRADSVHDQVVVPLLAANEMANGTPQAAVARLARSPSAALFRETFGPSVLDHAELAWNGWRWALEVFLQNPADFAPFSSRYDAFLRGQATLSGEELRGLRIFNDPLHGNCASCHPSAARHGAWPLFTDDGLIALGVPRNPAITANADPGFHDLGLCGPLRTDGHQARQYCGFFRTPSLRNAAKRRVFFHNGIYHHLDDAIRFYAQRDVAPRRIYGAAGRDLPAELQDNLNSDIPFGHHPKARALTAADVRALAAFLRTLDDQLVTSVRPGVSPDSARPR